MPSRLIAGGDDDLVGAGPVGDKGLVTVQREAIAGGGIAQGDGRRRVLAPLVDSEGKDALCRRNGGQMPGGQCLIAARRQRHGRHHGGGEEGRGGEIAAHGLADKARPGEAEAGAALLFRHQHPGKAHLAHAGPEALVIGLGIPAVAQRPEGGDGGMFGKETLGAVTQQGLVLGEDKALGFRHGATPERAWQ